MFDISLACRKSNADLQGECDKTKYTSRREPLLPNVLDHFITVYDCIEKHIWCSIHHGADTLSVMTMWKFRFFPDFKRTRQYNLVLNHNFRWSRFSDFSRFCWKFPDFKRNRQYNLVVNRNFRWSVLYHKNSANNTRFHVRKKSFCFSSSSSVDRL